MQELACLHAIVHGKVQGVFFRDFTQRHARALRLTGRVRNLPDGRSVEVIAEGERTALEHLLHRLRHGPTAAVVERLDASWSAYQGDLVGFQVVG